MIMASEVTIRLRLVIVRRWPMWLMRHDNLPEGCLKKHLWRILK